MSECKFIKLKEPVYFLKKNMSFYDRYWRTVNLERNLGNILPKKSMTTSVDSQVSDFINKVKEKRERTRRREYQNAKIV